MRLKTFIVEGKTSKEIDTFKNIEKDCQPYIKAVKSLNHVFIRYSRNLVPHQIRKTEVRKDRYPVDMPLAIHNVMDDLLYSKFGWKPRSEGVFCYSKVLDDSIEWSEYFIVFPTGDFSFVWSPEVSDLVTYLSGRIFLIPEIKDMAGTAYYKNVLPIVEDLLKRGNENPLYRKIMAVIKEVIKRYTDKDLRAALRSLNEISVRCDSYYMVGGSRYYKDLLRLFGKDEID